jgi:hypothetical protein
MSLLLKYKKIIFEFRICEIKSERFHNPSLFQSVSKMFASEVITNVLLRLFSEQTTALIARSSGQRTNKLLPPLSTNIVCPGIDWKMTPFNESGVYVSFTSFPSILPKRKVRPCLEKCRIFSI